MNQQYPQFQQQSYHPAPQAPKKPMSKEARIGWTIFGALGILTVGIIIGAAAGDNSTSAVATPQPTVTVTLPNTGPSPDPVVTPTNIPKPPTYATPVAKDFKLTVKTLRKACFGSAGCNVTYRLSVDYVGKAVDPSKTYQVTYEVRGLEDGPAINTFTMQGADITGDAEEDGSTTSSKAKLTAVATGVLEG